MKWAEGDLDVCPGRGVDLHAFWWVVELELGVEGALNVEADLLEGNSVLIEPAEHVQEKRSEARFHHGSCLVGLVLELVALRVRGPVNES